MVQEPNKKFTILSLLKRTEKKQAPVAKAHNVLICDNQCYSFFSFIMFNYLLKELRKNKELISDRKYINSMQELILYVYDYQQDSFIVSINLLKPDYLSYYIELNIEDEHIRRSDEVLRMISDLRKKFRAKLKEEQSAMSEESRLDSGDLLEQDIGNVFGTLEILMGLQDETYSIRLMLTERKIPELLVEIFCNIRHPFIGNSGDELIIQGLKVLYQLCKGNYPGQA